MIGHPTRQRLLDLQSLCDAKRARLAVAESITSGGIAASLGSLDGISRVFLGGVTAYTLQSKVAILGVDSEVAEPNECVSEGVAEGMARGVACLFGANLAVATTGFASRPKGVEPNAFYSVWRQRPNGQVEIITREVRGSDGMERKRMQAKVRAEAIASLILVLQRETA